MRSFQVERLEGRSLLTSVVYIDYGDRFPAGQLSDTLGNLITIPDGPHLIGREPLGADPWTSDTVFTLTTFNQVFAGTAYPGGLAQYRRDIDALVQRYYEPFDVQVVDLTDAPQLVQGYSVRAASSLTDVANTLLANDAEPKHHDAYILVGQMFINGIDPSYQFGGIADNADIGGPDLINNTALTLIRPDYGISQMFIGQTIAHEAGHTFGLVHSFGNDPATPPPGSPIDPNLVVSDLMSYLNSQDRYASFTRFPLPQGDGNLDNTVIRNAYQQMAIDDFADIGPSNIEYVTGTGANDIVTITKASAHIATVTVQAFDDTAYTQPITVPGPGPATTTYTYIIDPSRPILIEGGAGSDRFVIDASLGTQITVRGMSEADQLIVNANGVADGSYTPNPDAPNGIDMRPSFGGQVVAGQTTIDFSEFNMTAFDTSSVVVSGFNTFAMTAPDSFGNELTLDSPVSGQNRISGTGGGIFLVPLTFSGSNTFTLNTGSGSDTLSIRASADVALTTGLHTMIVNAGAGNDLLTVDSTNGAFNPVNGLQYNGGTGNNTLTLVQDAGATAASLDTYSPGPAAGAGESRIVIDGLTQLVSFTGLSPVNDSVPGPLNVNGTSANNIINYMAGLTPTDGMVAVDGFESINFTNKTTLGLFGQAGDDTITVNNSFTPTDLTGILVQGGTGNDTLVVDAGGQAVTSADVAASSVNIPTQVGITFSVIEAIHIIDSTGSLVATASNFPAVEAAQATGVLVASFRFSDAVPPTLFSVAGDFTAEIDWGDGTPTTAGTIATNGVNPTDQLQVFGSHTYAEHGIYNVLVTIIDKGSSRTFAASPILPVTISTRAGATVTAGATETVADAPLTAQAATVGGIEGLSLASTAKPPGATDVLVATFTDPNPNALVTDFSAAITWGDGATSAATRITQAGSPNGVTFYVFGNHTYSEHGSYPLSVTITDIGGAVATSPLTFAVIADAPLSPTFIQPVVNATEGVPMPVTVVGSLLDANPVGLIGDFVATIDWGDGTPRSTGTISGGGAGLPFLVSGAHLYADAGVNGGSGSYQIKISVEDKGGETVTLINAATVLDVPLTLSGQLNPASDSGASNADAITNVTQPNFFGTTSERDAKLFVYATATGSATMVLLGQTEADSNGAWSLTSGIALANGSYTITAQAVDDSNHTFSAMTLVTANLVIDTVGPKVTDLSFQRLSGQVQILFQDFGGVANGGVGLNQLGLMDANNYTFSRLPAPHSRSRHVPSYLVTTISVNPGSTVGAQLATILVNNGKPIRGGQFLFTARSVDPSNLTGVQDLAGNALDGEFYGSFASGNNHVGGNFIARIDSIHHKVYPPTTVIGPASPVASTNGSTPRTVMGAQAAKLPKGAMAVKFSGRHATKFANQAISPRVI